MAKGKVSARTMAKGITLFLTIVEDSILIIVFSHTCVEYHRAVKTTNGVLKVELHVFP